MKNKDRKECHNSELSTTRLLNSDPPILVKKDGEVIESVLFLPKREGRKGEGGLRTKGCFKRSYPGKPLISIITVVYNGEEHIEETIRSVIGQSYDNVEYIVIDGGSADGTVDLIRKYEEYIDYWVSEPDTGLYDAMNKGVRLAMGDFVNFLNADDAVYSERSLEEIVRKIDDYDTLYFGRAFVQSETLSWLYPDERVVDFDKWLKWSLPNHQSMFFPKAFYRRYTYDTRLRISADDDYKLQALKSVNVRFVDQIYVRFRRGGISSDHTRVDLLMERIRESFIRNGKHHRWIRFAIDPFKLLILFSINSLIGKENFSRFIRMYVKVKS